MRGHPIPTPYTRKVGIWLPGRGSSNSHGARSVHQVITTMKWIRIKRLSIKNSLYTLLPNVREMAGGRGSAVAGREGGRGAAKS